MSPLKDLLTIPLPLHPHPPSPREEWIHKEKEHVYAIPSTNEDQAIFPAHVKGSDFLVMAIPFS
jgi:hypothetical protein